jgi:hypothetical protein
MLVLQMRISENALLTEVRAKVKKNCALRNIFSAPAAAGMIGQTT